MKYTVFKTDENKYVIFNHEKRLTISLWATDNEHFDDEYSIVNSYVIKSYNSNRAYLDDLVLFGFKNTDADLIDMHTEEKLKKICEVALWIYRK